MTQNRRSVIALVLAALAPGCTTPQVPTDAFVPSDVPAFDGGVPDAGSPDPDGGLPDASRPDGGGLDAGADAGGPDAPMPTDAPMSDAPFTGEGIVYIVDAFHLPSGAEGPAMDVAPGVNLDGVITDGTGSTTCVDLYADLTSPSGEPGVDNELVASLAGLIESLTGTTLQSQLDAGVADGSFVLAIELIGAESLVTDADVTVRVYLVKAEGCLSETCPLPSGVTAGQTWIIRGSALASSTSASIAGGRLRASFDALPFPVAVFGPGSSLSLRDAVITGRLSPTALTEAAMAGALTIDDLVAASAGTGVDPTTVRSILEGLADLVPTAADPLLCSAVSAGVGVNGVPGTLTVE